MHNLSNTRLWLLRAMYLLIVLGNSVTIVPEIIAPPTTDADPHSVIRSFLGALTLLSLLGIRYPVQMIPILLFELCWKTLWIVAFASRMWLNGGLDEYATGVLVACTMGVVLTPLVLPWDYVCERYLKAKAEPWRR